MYVGVTFEEALRLHEMIVQSVGGESGVLDHGRLEACLAAPILELSSGPAYETLGRAAGALLHGIAQSHPFMDANKRAAIVITGYFLGKNGYRLTLPPSTLEHFTLASAQGETVRERIGELLESNIERVVAAESDEATLVLVTFADNAD